MVHTITLLSKAKSFRQDFVAAALQRDAFFREERINTIVHMNLGREKWRHCHAKHRRGDNILHCVLNFEHVLDFVERVKAFRITLSCV